MAALRTDWHSRRRRNAVGCDAGHRESGKAHVHADGLEHAPNSQRDARGQRHFRSRSSPFVSYPHGDRGSLRGCDTNVYRADSR